MTKFQIIAGTAISTIAALGFSAHLIISGMTTTSINIETVDKAVSPAPVQVINTPEVNYKIKEVVISTPLPSPPVEQTDWYHYLIKDEFITACKIVMGEAGGESYEGMMAVAQCILAACEIDNLVPSEVRTEYKYSGWREEYSKQVEEAVLAVFRDGERVCKENIIFFYAPGLCNSAWHETQQYILTIGGHKFFAAK